MGHAGSHDRYPARAVLSLLMQKTNVGQYTYQSLTRILVVLFFFVFLSFHPCRWPLFTPASFNAGSHGAFDLDSTAIGR